MPLALLNLSQGNKGSSEVSLAQVMELLTVIPTNEQMTDLTAHMTRVIDEKLAQTSVELGDRMDKITIVAGHLPSDMARELYKQLKSLFLDVSRRLHEHDLTLLKTIDEHKQVVQLLQHQNESSIKSLIDNTTRKKANSDRIFRWSFGRI